MTKSPYELMQAAVDIVSTSPHPTNKIAATLAGTTPTGEPFAISRVNHWPKAIADTIGTEPDIGNSSGTLHAETACILDTPKTKGASVFITDPPCPNCMKNLAEAGIAKLYIDHKGFDKDWAKRRGESFDQMSMRIASKAGIDVFVIYRKEQRFEVISRHPPGYKPDIDHPAHIECTGENFETLIEQTKNTMQDEPFAIARAHDENGKCFVITTDRHPSIGYTFETVERKMDKYSFVLQPLNRLLMVAAREGLALDPEHIYSSRCPTSRELVNFIGAGLNALQIGDPSASRDACGPKALKQLAKAKVLKLT